MQDNLKSAQSHLTDELKTTLLSRNVTVSGRRTSVRLEPEMWSALRDIAQRERCAMHDICTLISLRKKARTSLTSAIRVFMMLYFRAASTKEGHSKAGHGDITRMLRRARVPAQVTSVSHKNEMIRDSGRMPETSPGVFAEARQGPTA